MKDDVELNKRESIERCVRRVREVYADTPSNLIADLTRQDSIILNIQRACEAAIDLAMHRVREHRLGAPQDSRDAFVRLEKAGLLPQPLSQSLQRMVGFRNVAVHQYQKLNLVIVEHLIRQGLIDLLVFAGGSQ
jgi:uncharacterized protein YutE (UPF0331/DUF86 family)